MLVGYVRVSTVEQRTVEQSEERQIIELREKAGVEKFFVDKVSAKSAQRPKFDEMMNFLREGDELIVSEFSRLARSTTDLLNIVETLTKKDVKVRSLKEQLDTSTPQGRFMLTIFGAIAEFERELQRELQRELLLQRQSPNITKFSRPTVYKWLRESKEARKGKKNDV